MEICVTQSETKEKEILEILKLKSRDWDGKLGPWLYYENSNTVRIAAYVCNAPIRTTLQLGGLNTHTGKLQILKC